MAGINHFVYREKVDFLTFVKYFNFVYVPKLGDKFIAEAHLLRFLKNVVIHYVCGDNLFKINNFLNSFKEKMSNLGHFMHGVDRNAVSHKLGYGVNAVVTEFLDIFHKLVVRFIIELSHVEVANADFKRTNRLKHTFFKSCADAHNFARGFHLCTESVGGRGKFVKRETRELGHYIVKSRLKGGGCVGDCNIFKRHTYGDFGRYAGNRVAAGF